MYVAAFPLLFKICLFIIYLKVRIRARGRNIRKSRREIYLPFAGSVPTAGAVQSQWPFPCLPPECRAARTWATKWEAGTVGGGFTCYTIALVPYIAFLKIRVFNCKLIYY